MKIFKFLVITLLFVITTTKVGAQNSIYAISSKPISVIDAGTFDNEIVNQAGMTGKSVRLMLDAWCQYRLGISLHRLITEGEKHKIKRTHYNTQAFTDGTINVYPDRSPEGEAWGWHGDSLVLKDECCNLIGTDGGAITNFLASYAKQSNSQNSEAYKIGDGNSANQNQQNQNLNKDTVMDVNVKFQGLETVTQQTNNSNQYGWIIAIVAMVILAGLLIYFVVQASVAAKKARKDDKKAIKNFEKMKSSSNRNSARDFTKIGKTLKKYSA